ncbi:MAG: YdcF family protein [Bacteroidia bacterium]|nr:YdcF family protein [Bacteroidia bacterium]MDW8348155.1 YdcF family protein [Bacteroidia bacterium]
MKLSAKKRWIIFIAAPIIIVFLLIIFRVSILRSIGNYLIYQDKLQPCEVIFVLSGSADERAKHAAFLFHKKYAPQIVCTGAIIPENIELLDLPYTEAELTKIALTKRYQVPDTAVHCLLEGTSTKEEADAIAEYAQKLNLKKIMIISTAFHTNRVRQIFQKKFRQNKNISLCIQPAPALDYNEHYWWKDEEGLLTVYTEYAKKMYYFFKY